MAPIVLRAELEEQMLTRIPEKGGHFKQVIGAGREMATTSTP